MDRNLLGKLCIILSLKLASIPHSCPHMPGHCDVITPPYSDEGWSLILVDALVVSHVRSRVLVFGRNRHEDADVSSQLDRSRVD
jgi:hypothetical protein